MPPYSDIHSHSSSSCCDAPPVSRQPLHHAHLTKSTSVVETRHELLQLAALELEEMRSPYPRNKRGSNCSTSSTGSSNSNSSGSNRSMNSSTSTGSCSSEEEVERSFPPACLHLLQALPGNSRCHDCNTTNNRNSQSSSSPASSSSAAAEWASVSFGITLCLQCSGKHRGLGVRTSFIKSLTLDSWKRREILAMLEGGNVQLCTFFDRHGMGGLNDNGNTNTIKVEGLDRYNTKAASFYRQHLVSHARELAEKDGLYQGREASRQRSSKKSNCSSSTKNKAKGGALSPSSKSGKSRKKPREAVSVTATTTTKNKKNTLPTVVEKESVV